MDISIPTLDEIYQDLIAYCAGQPRPTYADYTGNAWAIAVSQVNRAISVPTANGEAMSAEEEAAFDAEVMNAAKDIHEALADRFA